MAKDNIPVPPITSISKYLKRENFLPVYFFFGEDAYSVDKAVELVESKVKQYLASDFDKQIFLGNNLSVVELEDMASAFPFGSELKLIIVKNFDQIKGDRKNFAKYIRNPSPSTILILSKEGPINALKTEPYLSMLAKNYMFEAKELKGAELTSWIIRYAHRHGKEIQQDEAELLVNMVGENKSLIEMQMQKILAYLGDNKNISHEVITGIASELKEFSIFDLLNALGNRDKYKSIETANNILDKSTDRDKEALIILTMFCKYFSSVARIPEIEKEYSSEKDRARIAEVHPYYYKNYKNASRYYQGKKLLDVTRALFEADLELKSTGTDPVTVILSLIVRILS